MKTEIDYTKLEGPALLDECGMDPTKWAAAFCQTAKLHGHNLDEGWMTSWFANAIMNTHDILTGNRVTVLPDGSAFFVAEVGK